MKVTLPILLLLSLLAPGGAVPVLAQAGGEAAPADTIVEPIELEGVVVEVTRARQDLMRTPQSVSVVGEREIELAQRRVTIDETLRRVPGVFATERHNYTLGEGIRLSIRAPQARIGTRGLQLLQDGIPLTTADGTTVPNNLDLGSAGRVEVIRGPSSVLYGNSAGGVVNVETRFPPDQALLLQPEIQIGSHGYNRQQVRMEGTGGGVGYVVNVNRMETEGFRGYGSAEIRRANLVTRVTLTDRTALRAIFNLYDMPFAENPSSLTLDDALGDPTSVRQLAFDQRWGKSLQQGQGGIGLEHILERGDRVQVLGWALWRENWNPIPFRIIDLNRRAAGVRSEYGGEAELGSWPVEWITGFDVSYQRDDRREFANLGVQEGGDGHAEAGDLQIDQLEEVLSLGPFVQATFRPHPEWSVTSGLRYDHYAFEANDRFPADVDQSGDRRLSAWGPTVGLTYTPTPGIGLFANIASAYQTPTTVELSNRPDGGRGFHDDLEAEELRSFELGMRGILPERRLSFEVAGYLSTVRNGLLRYEGEDEQAFFRNAGRISRDGLEVALDWAPFSGLEARAAYTYQDFVFEHFEQDGVDYSGNKEPGAPPHQIFLGATHTASFGLSSSADVRWFDAYPANDANTASNWSHMIVDLRFGMEVALGGTTLRPFFGVQNALDERYNASVMLNAIASRYYEPAPGRTFYLGFSSAAGW